MEKLKKIISLNQAAKLSGYSQDYLGYLIRQGELRGQKVGRNWFTTEEEVKTYLFKQKVRHRELAISDFFSKRRTSNIILAAFILFFGFFAAIFYIFDFQSNKSSDRTSTRETLSPEAEAQEIIKE